MIRTIFKFVVLIIFLLIAGHFIVDQFPETKPYIEQGKEQLSTLYHTGLAKFGLAGMAIIIIALLIAATSRR